MSVRKYSSVCATDGVAGASPGTDLFLTGVVLDGDLARPLRDGFMAGELWGLSSAPKIIRRFLLQKEEEAKLQLRLFRKVKAGFRGRGHLGYSVILRLPIVYFRSTQTFAPPCADPEVRVQL